jgi:hypothetical protein
MLYLLVGLLTLLNKILSLCNTTSLLLVLVLVVMLAQ